MASTPALRSTSVCRICQDQQQEAWLIQSALLPAGSLRHGSVEIAFRYASYEKVGGDFADFFELPDGLVGLYVGDVVGKGLAGAMYASLAMGMMRGIHKTGTDPASVLALLNQRLLVRPVPGRFCSSLFALFNPYTRQLMFSNAGLPLPYLLTATGCRPLGEGGLPSGMFAGAIYDRHTAQLSQGDAVLFATDGVHELCNRDGMEFDVAQISRIWGQSRDKSADEFLTSLFDGMSAFSDGVGLHDDATAVILKTMQMETKPKSY